MSHEKIERNKLIVKLIEENWSYEEVRKEVGLKSKATVYHIYKRYLENKGISSLSTRK